MQPGINRACLARWTLPAILALALLLRLPGHFYPVTFHYDEGAELQHVLKSNISAIRCTPTVLPIRRLTRLRRFDPDCLDCCFAMDLICKAHLVAVGPKPVVVQTLPLPSGYFPWIIAWHVPAPVHPQERRKRTLLLEHCREQALKRRARDSASRALPGGNQFLAVVGVARVN